MALRTVSHDEVPFALIVDSSRGVLTMSLHGELDLACTDLLATVGHEEDNDVDDVVVDLAELDFADTAGIHALVGFQRRNQARGRQVSLAAARGCVRRMFTLTGRDDALVPVGDLGLLPTG